MSDTPSKPAPIHEQLGPTTWAATQATRLSGAGPLPGPEAVADNRKAVLCVKCEFLNEVGVDKCARCGSHLFVFCHRCGTKNPRVHSRCENCRRRLHRSVKDRMRGADSLPINMLYVGLSLVGIILAIVVLALVSGFRLPRLW